MSKLTFDSIEEVADWPSAADDQEVVVSLGMLRELHASSGWKEATIAWEVCASIHRQWAKGKDALFSTRQADFVRHAETARAASSQTTQPQAASGWLPIETAPVGKQMFVVRAFNAPMRGGGTYTTDPYCVWQEQKGRFQRWPHGAMPPTHYMLLPPDLAKDKGETHE